MPHRDLLARLALAAACVAALAACDGDRASPTPDTVTVPSTAVRADDGVALFGLVVPRVGTGAEIGASVTTAVQLAIDQVNGAGGINGQPIRLVVREEGNTPATTVLALQELVQLGVDAIIGPTSSIDALGALDVAVDAGVLTCSPTASALALDAYPDNGLFLRTVPSDSLQARAIARVVDESGSRAAVVTYLDDPYGRPFANAVNAALLAGGTQVTESVAFSATGDSIAAAVARVVAATPDMVVVVADDTTGPTVISEIDRASTNRELQFVVNDAIRRPSASTMPFGPTLAARVEGVSPLPYAESSRFLDALHQVDATATGLYAHNAYDCVNLIALAAEAASTLEPAAVSAAVPGVSAGGTACSSFPECSPAQANGRNIDYESPGGELAIGANGDPSRAVFERFGFDSSGRDVRTGSMVVGTG